MFMQTDMGCGGLSHQTLNYSQNQLQPSPSSTLIMPQTVQKIGQELSSVKEDDSEKGNQQQIKDNVNSFHASSIQPSGQNYNSRESYESDN